MEKITDTDFNDSGFLEIPTSICFDPDPISAKHKKQGTWKYTALCTTPGDIDLYYSDFLFKRYGLILNRSIRLAHVTIINDRVEDLDKYNAAKEKWNGKQLVFKYRPDEIRSNGTHWWIKVYCDEVAEIRTMAGLTPQPFFNLHMTLGYANDKNADHSQYILRQILTFEKSENSSEGVMTHKAKKTSKPRVPKTVKEKIEEPKISKNISKRQFAKIGDIVKTTSGEIVKVTKKNAKDIGRGGFTMPTLEEVFVALEMERARADMYETRITKMREFFEPLREALY